MLYLFVALGGIVGATARFALGGWIVGRMGDGFPWATLLINLLGSVVLGWLMRVLPSWNAGPELRALLTVGFCGSFTTFSTFGYETATLLERGAYTTAGTYVAGSVALGVAGVFLGLWIGGWTA